MRLIEILNCFYILIHKPIYDVVDLEEESNTFENGYNEYSSPPFYATHAVAMLSLLFITRIAPRTPLASLTSLR